MLTDNDWERVRRWFEANNFYVRFGSSGLILFLLVWLILGFVAPWIMVPWVMSGTDTWSQAAANIGDMFGLVNSLFSGVALIGVVAALLLQTMQLRSEERFNRRQLLANRRQLEVSRKTARIETLTFLAELQRNLMVEAPDPFKAHYKNYASWCANRAVDLMQSLGETFEGLPHRPCVPIRTDADFALLELGRIRMLFLISIHDASPDINETTGQIAGAARMLHSALTDWVAQYQPKCASCGYLVPLIGKAHSFCGPQAVRQKPPKDDPIWSNSENWWPLYWQVFDDLRQHFSEACKMFERDIEWKQIAEPRTNLGPMSNTASL